MPEPERHDLPPYPRADPPAVLYHAVPADRVATVLADGLVPAGKPHVHLSRRPEHARNALRPEVGPTVLIVDAAAMSAAGHAFFCSPKATWLVGAVPRQYLRVQ